MIRIPTSECESQERLAYVAQSLLRLRFHSAGRSSKSEAKNSGVSQQIIERPLWRLLLLLLSGRDLALELFERMDQ